MVDGSIGMSRPKISVHSQQEYRNSNSAPWFMGTVSVSTIFIPFLRHYKCTLTLFNSKQPNAPTPTHTVSLLFSFFVLLFFIYYLFILCFWGWGFAGQSRYLIGYVHLFINNKGHFYFMIWTSLFFSVTECYRKLLVSTSISHKPCMLTVVQIYLWEINPLVKLLLFCAK